MKIDKLFGVAAIIFACGYFVRSLPFAKAQPTGPNTSYGNNPIANFYGNQNGTVTLPLDSTTNFIITTAFSNQQNCSLQIDGNAVNYSGNNAGYYNPLLLNYDYRKNSVFTLGEAKLKVNAGQTVTLNNCETYYIEGYYTH